MRRNFRTPAIVVPSHRFDHPRLVDLGEPVERWGHLEAITAHLTTASPALERIADGTAVAWQDPERAGLRVNRRMLEFGVSGIFGDAVITGPADGTTVTPVPDALIERFVPEIEPPGVGLGF